MKINSWPIDEGQYATFGPDDFERYWLHGADRSDKLSDTDIAEMVEHCLYVAELERREMTQTLAELRAEARDWADDWNQQA